MSSKEKKQITCPKCSKEQTVIFWKSVNVQLSPEAKEKVLSGELNMFQCEACSHKTRIETSFLYHDMEKEFLAMYYPLIHLTEPNFAADFDNHGRLNSDMDKNNSSKDYDYAQDIHIVFDIGELKNYIFFREMLFQAHKQ